MEAFFQLKFLNKFLLFTLNCILLGFTSMSAQSIRGTVKDEQNSPLPGVSVSIKGTTVGTLTNSDGNFKISMDNSGQTLVFSSVGFTPKEVVVTNQTTLEITLSETNHALNELVIVGYGIQKKSDVTGAISSIKNKDFKEQPVANIAQSIQGKISGINITAPSGTPGAGLIVNIRGASNALYVVDGIPMISESNSSLSTSYNTNGESVGNGQNISSIADLNPDDIESIEVLKDASAASIYGARAANGVILITTKRGKTQKTSINFNYYTGTQTLQNKIKFLNASDFISLTKEAIANDINVYNRESKQFGKDSSRYGTLADLTSDSLFAPFPYDNSSGINTNWLDQIFRTAPISNYEISARGGSEKTQFFISGSYFDQTGIIIENYLKRFNGRVNLDHQVNKKLGFGTTITLSRTVNRRSFNDNTYTGIVTNALGASPLMPVYEKDGSYAEYTNYQAVWLSDNPVKSAKEIQAFTKSNRFLGSVYAELKILPSLKLKSTWSIDYTGSRDNQYFSPLTVDAQSVSGKVLDGSFNNITWLNDNILTYQQHFGDHYLDALAGFTRQESVSDQTFVAGQGLPLTGGLKTISSTAVITNATQVPTSWYLTSFLSRVNYTFKNKLLASVSFRADASSRFPKSKRVGYFPSGSLGYNFSEEKFLKDLKVFDALKLRASYGTLGDQEIGNFQHNTYWALGKYNGVVGIVPNNVGNQNLTWQRNTIFNLGIDFAILHNLLEGSIEFFNANRTKLLSENPIAGTTGFKSFTGNSGNIEDKGLEFQLTSQNIRNQNFNWTTSFNISFLKNTIKSLAVDGLLISSYNDSDPSHILKVGQSLGTFVGIPFLGVDPQTGDALYRSGNGDKIRADEVDFSRDVAILGKARPDYFGGISNTFTYKNWGFNISMPFSVGNKVFNQIRGTTESLGWNGNGSTPADGVTTANVYSNTTQDAYNRRWRKPGDITDIPRASFVQEAWYPNGGQFFENASFLKIKTVNLSYTLRPKSLFSSIKLYAQVQNLYTFTKYTGFDPEVSSTGGGNEATAGVDYAAYPSARTITFGINLGL